MKRHPCLLFVLLLSGFTAWANTYVVVTTADQGNGSLIWAISQANSTAGADTVEFAIPTTDANYKPGLKAWVISCTILIPTLLDDRTFIDGSSQVRRIGVNNSKGPEIEIQGSATIFEVPGIKIESAYNKIIDIAIGRFHAHTFWIEGNGAHHNIIQGCYIGYHADGNPFNWNYNVGVQLRDGASHNLIGGSNASERNLIGNHFYEAIEIVDAHHNYVRGNWIGLDPGGTRAVGNGWGDGGIYASIYLRHDAYANEIGGSQPGQGNVICASGTDGINIFANGTFDNIIRGNYIGIAPDGETAIANHRCGISVSVGVKDTVGPYNNIIGGTEPGDGNVISGNESNGIQVLGAFNNRVEGNYIGTNAACSKVVANLADAVLLGYDARNNCARQNTIGPGNVIIANVAETEGFPIAAIKADGNGTAYNMITGNFIGSNSEGTLASQYNSGIVLSNGSHHNLIGPDNVISRNNQYGILVGDANSISNTITRNSIYDNGLEAIFLLEGGNRGLMGPLLLTVMSSRVMGVTYPFGTVEIFSDSNDEARYYHGSVNADKYGNFFWSGSTTLTYVAATVTDQAGNTSALSNSRSVPVELALFQAHVNGAQVYLTWATESESNNLGFFVERKIDGEFQEIAFIPGAGTSSSAHVYKFINIPESNGHFTYRLRQVDQDGFFTYSSDVSVTVGLPEKFVLQQPYPNPFNSRTVIKYSIADVQEISITVVNINGQVVRTLADGMSQPGRYLISWDGTDDLGKSAPSGVYFCRFVSAGHCLIRKVSLVK